MLVRGCGGLMACDLQQRPHKAPTSLSNHHVRKHLQLNNLTLQSCRMRCAPVALALFVENWHIRRSCRCMREYRAQHALKMASCGRMQFTIYLVNLMYISVPCMQGPSLHTYRERVVAQCCSLDMA